MHQPDADALLPVAQDVVSKAVEHVPAHPFTDIREKDDRDIVTDTDEAVDATLRTGPAQRPGPTGARRSDADR